MSSMKVKMYFYDKLKVVQNLENSLIKKCAGNTHQKGCLLGPQVRQPFHSSYSQ